MRKLLRLPRFIFLLYIVPCLAQESQVNQEIIQKIRDEGLHHSQVMQIAHYLTDESGPRLTNSPGFKRAADWAVTRLKSWGLKAGLEAWGDFGPGWESEKCYVAMKSPYYHPLIAYPLAWTKGTAGLVKADVVMIESLSVESVKKHGASLKGKIVLPRQNDTTLRSAFEAYATRYGQGQLDSLKDSNMITADELNAMMSYINGLRDAIRLLQKIGSLGVLNMSSFGRDGTVDVSGWFSGKKENLTDLMALNLATEDYLCIQRLLEAGTPVKLELDLKSKMIVNDNKGYNVIGEIPGTDPSLKSELVMIGGHLDSWHSATGATDNGAGCAVMMEAIRILQALQLHLKRTIRIALWSGEEQGLLGSHAYVKKHFGDPTNMKLLPEQSKISAYYNLDNGSGRIRGIYLQGNKEVLPVFKEWLQPFSDLDATTLTLCNTGSTDHLSFDAVGIPGFQFIQDPMEYETRTHHTNMDSYDHLFPEDLKQAATIVAALVYETAMRQEKLPRKPLPATQPWIFDLFK